MALTTLAVFAPLVAAGLVWLDIQARGRIPWTQYRKWISGQLLVDDWTWPERVAAWKRQTRRAGRCAACGAGAPAVALDTHHWTYANLGYERRWQVCWLCRACHDRVGRWGHWLLGGRNRRLWLSTLAVVAVGRGGQLWRRATRPGNRRGRLDSSQAGRDRTRPRR